MDSPSSPSSPPVMEAPQPGAEDQMEVFESEPPVLDVRADDDHGRGGGTGVGEGESNKGEGEEEAAAAAEAEEVKNLDPSVRKVWERYLAQLGPGVLGVIERLDLDARLYLPDFDLTDRILKRLPLELPKGYVENLWEQVERMRSRVVAVLSRQVREHHEVFMQGICNIYDIKLDVAQTRVLCHNTRSALRQTDENMVGGIVSVLVKKRRAQRLRTVAQNLTAVREALRLEAELDLQLRRDDFPAAIVAYRACHNAAQSLPKFHCMSGLRERMRTGKSLIKRKLQSKLKALCRSFTSADLLAIIHTYRMLEEDMLLAADLKEAYMNAVVQITHEALVDAVRGRRRAGANGEVFYGSYAGPDGGGEDVELERLRVRELCGLLTTERFAGCVLHILSELSQLLHSYNETQDHLTRLLLELQKEEEATNKNDGVKKEEDGEKEEEKDEEGGKEEGDKENEEKRGGVEKENQNPTAEGEEGKENSSSSSKKAAPSIATALRMLQKASVRPVPALATAASYVSTLVLNSKVLWQYVQAKAGVVISSVHMDTTSLPVEDFLRVLSATDRFLVLGEQLTNSNPKLSHSLRNVVKRKSQEYFQKFHVQTFERIKLLMSSETWRRLPLPDFDPKEIVELRPPPPTLARHPPHELLQRFRDGEDLFLSGADGEEVEMKSNDGSGSKAEGQNGNVGGEGDSKEDEKAEGKGDKKSSDEKRLPIILVSVAAKVAQFMGRYMRLMEAFPDSIGSLLEGLQQLFDLYLYTVLSHFLVDPADLFVDTHSELESNDSPTANNNNNDNGQAGAETPPFSALRAAALRIRDTIDAGRFGSAALFARRPPTKRGSSTSTREPPPAPPSSAAPPRPPAHRKGHFRSESSSAVLSPQARAFRHRGGSSEQNRHSLRAPADATSSGSTKDRSSSPGRSPARIVEGVTRATSFMFGSFAGPSPRESTLGPVVRIPPLVALSQKLDLKSRMNIRGFNERLNAAESTVFLIRVLRAMRPRLVAAATSAGAQMRARVEALERTAIQVIRELRARVHRELTTLFIEEEELTKAIISCKWDIHELSSRNHQYVDQLVNRLRDSAAVMGAHGILPPHLERVVFHKAVAHVMRTLVDSYAQIRKCTTEGRAAMSLDLNVLRSQISKLSKEHLKTLPLWDYANDFIKAYYLPEDDLCKWVAEHPGYTLNHYRNIAVVGAGAGMRSKRRERLLQRIESVFKGGEFAKNRRALEASEETEEIKLIYKDL